MKNNKQRTCIVVESPLQLLCAYEAIEFFKLNYILYVRFSDNQLNNSQMKVIIDELNLKNVKYFTLGSKKNLFNILKLISLISKIKIYRYDSYILGDYLSGFLRLLMKFINQKKVILLDDGVATFKIQKELETKNLPIDLFTMFDIKSIPNQKIFNNNFKALQNRYTLSNTNEVDIFIGGKLVDLEIVTLDTYLAVLHNVIKKSDTGKLLYFPHRGTSQIVLDEISSIEGVELIYPDVTVEFYLLKKNIYPKNIYSILSTALFSLSKIFDTSTVVAFKPNFLKNDRENHIDNIYDRIKNHKHIKIIELSMYKV